MLQRKLFTIYTSVIVVVVTLFLSVMNRTLFRIMNESVRADNESVISQLGNELDLIIQTSESALLDLCISEDIQKGLQSSPYATDSLSPKIYYGKLQATIRLYPFDAAAGFPRAPAGEDFSRPRKEWFEENKAQNGSFLVTTLDEDFSHYLTISKIVFNNENWEQVIGILSIEYSYDLLNAVVLNQVKLNNSGQIYIVNQDNRTLLPYGITASNYLDNPVLSGYRSYVSGDHFIIERQIDDTPFYLIGSIPLADIYAASSSAHRIVIGAGLAAVMICVVASYWVARSFTRPIMHLADIMKDMKDGDLDIEVPNQYSGEIGVLYNSFNYMIHMIHTLINDNYLMNLRKKQSELDALQSQINAHFLYNTLDSINWLAKKYKADDISLMVTSLSKLLRLSLNSGENITTVEREVAHVQNYMEIQKVRYAESVLHVEYDVDEAIREARIIKLLLQPLVENAIVHGFEHSPGSRHEIFVSCRQAGKGIRLEVKQSGTNIDLAYVYSLIQGDSAEPPKSYGIRSICQRLRAHYGSAAHYDYLVENGYTTAVIQIDTLKD